MLLLATVIVTLCYCQVLLMWVPYLNISSLAAIFPDTILCSI